MFTLVTGDTSLILQTLKVDGVPFSIAGLTAQSRLVGKNCGTALTDVISNNEATSGADWANGIVAVIVPGTATEDIDCHAHPTVMLETQVDDGTYEKTWFTEISLTKGSI